MFKVENMSLYYGDKMASLENINMEIKEKKLQPLLDLLVVSKSSFLRSLNRMNDLIEEAVTTGSIKLKGSNIYDRKYDVIELELKLGWCSKVLTRFQCLYMKMWLMVLKDKALEIKVLKEIVERSLKQAALWEEVHDRLHESAMKLSGGQQQRLCIT